MALTFKDEGRLLAKITDGKYKNKIVAVIDAEKDNSFKSLNIKDGKFQHIPDPNTERQILYITGASGSGKSTYTSKYAILYRKIFPKNPIYVFSALKDDASLDVIKPKRFKITQEALIDDPIVIDDLANSLCIFDDIDCISKKELKEAVYNILNEILETGRHFNISCIITNHLPSNGVYTRRILNEAHSITYFPHSGNNGKLKKFLIDQIGLDKQDYINNKKAKSRWATIFKNYPMVNMTETTINLLGDEDEKNEVPNERTGGAKIKDLLSKYTEEEIMNILGTEEPNKLINKNLIKKVS